MAIPGYKLEWHRNPALYALAFDTVIATGAFFSAWTALLARGVAFGVELVLPALVLLAAVGKALITWREKGQTRTHRGLVGCLHTLNSVLLASAEGQISPGLRLTIHTPVKSDHGGQELEQIVDYVSDEQKLRGGAGRKFMPQCGILGKAYRTGKRLVAERESEDYEEYLKELVDKWSYSEAQARGLRSDGRSFMAVPLGEDGEIEAVLYLDSWKSNFFTANRVALIGSACTGMALFIGREYNKKQ